MFQDEQTQTTIYATLNDTLIRATLRAQDLVPVFLEAIRETPEYAQIMQSNNNDLQVIFGIDNDDDERWESEYMSYFLNETLFDVLDNYAPPGYYFGAHEGDGSDFGYWEIIED